MCEAHSQNAPDDIPRSDSDVVTPEENKSKQENPSWKLIVQFWNKNWVWEQKSSRENPRHAPDDIPQSDSDVVTPEQKKNKKEKTKKKTNRKSPRKLMKSFRGELIYNKKASWILIKPNST